MHNLPPLLRLGTFVALIALPAACNDSSNATYPQLMPLSELTAPPAIPGHAADASADPEAVGASLRARRAEAVGRVQAGPGADIASLDARAAALRDRADALAERDASGEVSISITPVGATDGAVTDAAPTDPETASRAEALRERARRMLDDGAPPSDAPSP